MFLNLGSRTTSIKRQGRQSGTTLIEMLVAMLVAAALVIALVKLSTSSSRSFAEILNYVDLNRANSVALDKLTREIRQTQFLASFQTNSLRFIDNDGVEVRYDYSGGNGTLVRTKNGQQSTLLIGCDSLAFGMYERAPLSNRFDLVTATDPTNCKVISVTWNCSRALLRLRANTEGAQVARIVIRNKQN